MSAQFRSPFDNFQPQLKISYEDDFQNKIDMIRNNAATLIQSHWRGYAARQQLCRAYDAATVIQAAWRGYITRRNLSGEYQAATAPQFNCRDNQARDDLRAPELRAAQIKNEWREFLQQWVFNQHTSPHASPCKYNECKSPTDLSVKNLAATIIQKWFKGYKTRKSLEKLMQASPVTQTNNSARHTLREPPRNLRFAANSSSDDSSRNYSSGSLDSFTNGRSNLYKTAKSGCSGAFTRQPSSSFTGPFYGKNIRKPQSQEQQIRENVLQGVGQAPVLTNFSSADSAEESEKDTACCQNPSVARQGQTRPLYRFEKSEKKLSHKMGATPTTQVYGSPYIHPLPLSIPFSCRKAIALAKSPDPKQDKGRGKTLYNIARAGQDIPMSNKSDFKLSGPAYRPDAFRRRLMLDFQSNQSQRPRDRRKNLYEHQPNKDDKYVLGKAENKPAVTANSPPCCRRHTMPEYSSNPSGFKGRSTFSNSRLNEQERHLPYKQEPDRPKTPNTIDMGNKQTNCNCSHGCSLCKAREKSRPLNDNKPHQSKPFLMFNPETCTGKVTCESPTGNPKDKANETKQSMRHNRREDRDELYPREVAHKPPVLPYSSESCKRKTGCRNCHEPSLELGQNQSNSSRRHDGQQQPEPSKAEPPIRKTFQHALNPTFEEGFGTRAKMSKQNQRSHCAGRECKGDLESCNDMEKTSKRTSATGFTYTGSKGRSDVGSCNTHKHDIQGPGMTPHKTRSDLGCSTFRGPRDASPGADSVSSGNTEANEMTDRWGAFKTGNRFQKELHRSCPTQSAWESTKMRMALKQHHKAATRIQALYRGYKVRQYLQTAGTLDKFDNRDEELRKKESKDVGDGQHFSMHARGSQKGGACQHRRDEHESRFHSESQCYRSALGNVSDGGDLRFNRRSRT
ncbi:hypothetical protein NDU88_005586 [Pleurodeles waltl]|uniref:Uncharacterized protein n=1 Tax=Pleurodeles waltl TaxID=8319 RepID=A0AAV7L4G0_PLEWA|nr:hypothetical protein NDU88_005586 [Pleurodeles waltl]